MKWREIKRKQLFQSKESKNNKNRNSQRESLLRPGTSASGNARMNSPSFSSSHCATTTGEKIKGNKKKRENTGRPTTSPQVKPGGARTSILAKQVSSQKKGHSKNLSVAFSQFINS